MATRASDVISPEQRSRGKGSAKARSRTETLSRPKASGSELSASGCGPWLNADQAAAYLALLSRKALYELVRAGRVPYYRFGHSLRFRREELDEVIAAGRMQPAVYERHKKEIEVDRASCAEQSGDYDLVDARLQQEGGK